MKAHIRQLLSSKPSRVWPAPKWGHGHTPRAERRLVPLYKHSPDFASTELVWLLNDPPGEGYTYVILAPSTERVKIGFSASHPAMRMHRLQCGSPEELQLLGFFMGNYEGYLHDKFKSCRLHREWFTAAPVLAWLNEHKLLDSQEEYQRATINSIFA